MKNFLKNQPLVSGLIFILLLAQCHSKGRSNAPPADSEDWIPTDWNGQEDYLLNGINLQELEE